MWYYSEGKQQKGPVTRETLDDLIQRGVILPDQLVWTESFGDQWRPANTVPGLIPSSSDLSEEKSVEQPTPQAVSPSTELNVPVYGSTTVQGNFFAENAELTQRARTSLRGYWGLGIGVFLLNFVIIQAVSNLVPVIGPFITLFISAPFAVGVAMVYLHVARSTGPEVAQLFSGFSSFWNALGVYFLTMIFTMLWMLLLIIPGIIASISYSQVYFLLADHPNLSPMDAIESSKRLMMGHKWQYFCLGFRFLGWTLLAMFLTLGIGMLWVIPYMQTAYAEFYLELRKHQKTV